jgi:hypothetical protein
MAKIVLLDQPVKTDVTGSDATAHDKASEWMARIEELFITERSKQIQIGISEVGMDCRKCVARKLAKVYRKPDGSWYPFIGTAVHDALERGFQERWPDEYQLENRLHVHSYKDLELGGSCDMAALIQDGKGVIVNDWKVVGKQGVTDAAKGKIKDQYRIQAQLYGYGWAQKGYNVTHVALSFLPREDKLQNAVVVLMRYDQDVALTALAEVESMIDAAEIVGWEKVIDKQPKASFCFSCRVYEQTDYMDIESMV